MKVVVFREEIVVKEMTTKTKISFKELAGRKETVCLGFIRAQHNLKG